MRTNRKIKLKEGHVDCFYLKNEHDGCENNPCGCDTFVFHEEYDGDFLYGVCNLCGKDIYKLEYNEEYIKNSEWMDKVIMDKKPLNVYVLVRDDDWKYDECIEQTIVAATDERAIELASKEPGVWIISKEVDLSVEQILTKDSNDG